MPTAALSPCSVCRQLNCTQHKNARAKAYDRYRGTAHSRGYTYTQWRPFRDAFVGALVAAEILPVCGAALPTGPRTQDSACQAQGWLTFTSLDGSSLHVDHEPPLREDERRDMAVVCDLNRVQLLCRSCHATKTGSGGR